MMIGRVPIRLRKGPHALEPEELSIEIEVAPLRPSAFDDIEPFLREIVARVVLALSDAEHLELALVPADHKVDAEASFANMVGGHELLRRYQRME
jgi:hypothetical protein